MINSVITFPRRFSDCTGYSDEKMTTYFGGDRTLSENIVIELLVSTSFGANSILYAVWLGYLMGMWAMLIHIAWCMSFFLLSKFSKRIYTHTSIHDFLDRHFGSTVRKISSICSIVGLLYFTGWEIAIAKSGLESFTMNFIGTSSNILLLILITIICIALLYTIIGGQRTNGYINFVINRTKFILLGIIIIGILYSLISNHQFSFKVLMPNFTNAIRNLGITGLITNILINLSWQFVDNSSWQIISSGHDIEMTNSNRILKKAGLQIFFIYAGETLLGAMLRSISGLNSDNILSGIIYIAKNHGNTFLFLCITLLMLFSMMSLIDGMSLSVAQTIMVDLNFGKIINMIKPIQNSNLLTARIVTLLLGIIATCGIQFALIGFGSSIFDFVYVFTVMQLCLIGPVIIGLVFSPKYISRMWISIVLSATLGIILNILGSLSSISWINDVAGTITALSSLMISLVLYWIEQKNLSSV